MTNEWNQLPPPSFLARVKLTDKCWLWTGSVDKNGYGLFQFKGKLYRAHRFSLLLNGEVLGPKVFACHKCDTPGCVRPSHLFLGSGRDNAADRDAKGKGMQGELNHKARLSEDDVREIRRLREFMQPKQIAKRFGISGAYVYEIVIRKSWRHVP